jgi:hypothetical protein
MDAIWHDGSFFEDFVRGRIGMLRRCPTQISYISKTNIFRLIIIYKEILLA